MHIGVNTFGLRGPFYRDRDNALERLKACGVSSLEVCVAFPSEERPRKRTAPQDENFDYVEARAAIWGNEDAPEKIDPETFLSKGRSTPFRGMEVMSRTELTLCGGRIVWQAGTIKAV